MTYQMFLDDLRDPPDGDWVVVRSYVEAISPSVTGWRIK